MPEYRSMQGLCLTFKAKASEAIVSSTVISRQLYIGIPSTQARLPRHSLIKTKSPVPSNTRSFHETETSSKLSSRHWRHQDPIHFSLEITSRQENIRNVADCIVWSWGGVQERPYRIGFSLAQAQAFRDLGLDEQHLSQRDAPQPAHAVEPAQQ